MPARAKSPACAPPIERPFTVTMPLPAFASVSVFAALVVPTVWLAKVAEVGPSEGAGPAVTLPDPDSATR